MTRVEKLILNSTVTNDMMSNVCFSPDTQARARKYILIWWLQWSPIPDRCRQAYRLEITIFKLQKLKDFRRFMEFVFWIFQIILHGFNIIQYLLLTSYLWHFMKHIAKLKVNISQIRLRYLWCDDVLCLQSICKTQQGCLHYITSSVSKIFVIKQ